MCVSHDTVALPHKDWLLILKNFDRTKPPFYAPPRVEATFGMLFWGCTRYLLFFSDRFKLAIFCTKPPCWGASRLCVRLSRSYHCLSGSPYRWGSCVSDAPPYMIYRGHRIHCANIKYKCDVLICFGLVIDT